MNQAELDAILSELLLEFQKDDRDALSLIADRSSLEPVRASRAARLERLLELGRSLQSAGGPALMTDMLRNVRRANGSWAERLEDVWKKLGYAPPPRLP